MYTQFFGLTQLPFSIAPDPRYLFMSERHREALAHLLYGLNGGGGFVLLTGEIGAGKTTVCRLFLEQIPARCNVAYIFNPKQTVTELLHSICDEFNVPIIASTSGVLTVKDYIDPLNRYLLATHAMDQNNVLIIDEAQNLSADVLEQLRLLTNLETSERKLLQIVLIGQPELRTMLARAELEQLAQRVIARFHLDALSANETGQYIAHRLGVAGRTSLPPFSRRAIRRIHQRTRGVPRRINLLCDRALLAAYAAGSQQVDAATVEQAVQEVFDFAVTPPLPPRRRYTVYAFLVVFLVGGVTLLLALQQHGQLRLPPALTAIAATTPPSVVKRPLPAAILPPPQLAIPITAQTNPPAPTVAAAVNAPPAKVSAAVRDSRLAYRQLEQLWQLPSANGNPCDATQQNIYCFSSAQGLSEIRQLDRPGVLTLHDDAQENYYALLLGLSDTSALLQIGETTEQVSLAALSRRWNGGFVTLWRGPPGLRKNIGIGDRGSAVDWLAERLTLANKLPVPLAQPAVYNDTLSTLVREFQLLQGLRPDGLPGPQTMMRLASVTGEAEPHLRKISTSSNTDATPLPNPGK